MSSLKKGQAFGWGLICTLGIFISALLAGASISDIFQPTLLAIVGLTTAFIGGNVADNGVKGKFYNSALEGL